MLELWLIRHGDPAYPRDALTEKGQGQARELGRYLSTQGLAGLFSSPMGRAVETAEAVADSTGLTICFEPWTAELESWAIQDPDRGEAPAWELSPVVARRREVSIDDWTREEALGEAHGLARRYVDLSHSSDEFLARLGWLRRGTVYEAGADAVEGRFGVVCHCGFALTWLSHLLCLSPTWVWTSFTLAPASITSVVFEHRGEVYVPRCHALGSTGFLSAAEENSSEESEPGS